MPAKQKDIRPRRSYILPVLTVVLSAVAVVVVIFAVFRVYNSYTVLQETEAQRQSCEAAIQQLMDSSDYLTEQVYKYGETRNDGYMERYWREIELYRRRDRAVEDILQSNLDEGDKERAVAAKRQSDELMILETRAMRLITESKNIPESELPSAVAEYELTPEEMALSDEEQYAAGLAYLHGTPYHDSKSAIENSVENFRSDVNRKFGQLSVRIAADTKDTVLFEGLVFVALVAMLIVTVLVYQLEIRERDRRVSAALEDANNANRTKGMFLSQISHDMRTPLTAIIGFSENTGDIGEAEAKDNLEKINTSGKHLLGLINDLLDNSKLESGNLPLNPTATSFGDTLQIISSTVLPAAEKKHINFSVSAINLTDDAIMVDELRLNQVLLNLLNNAINYTPEGGSVEFEVSMLSCTDTTQTHSFVVRDTGCGMSSEFQQRMFLAFSRENNSTYGSGLGLTIVKQLVDLMKGSISVKSAPGEGTEFTVVLTNDIAPPKSSESGQMFVSPDFNVLKGKKVLLAEDNEINAGLTVKLLNSKGIDVETASNGREALELFSASPVGGFDLIFMDVIMPVMGGLECTQRIRALGRADSLTIPIVALSANSLDENAQTCADAGMNGHLTKPIDTDALFRLMVKLLS